MTEKVIAVLVALLMGLVSVWYSWLIRAGEIEPVLATWFLFLVAASLGLWTYFKANSKSNSEGAPKRSTLTNIANTVDVVALSIIVASIIYYGGEEVRLGFSQLEWRCFGATVVIIGLYLVTGEAKAANVGANVILAIGYLPTMTKLWHATENTEPFGVWITVWFAASLALVNPIRKRDFLAALYAGRAVALVSVVLVLMMLLE